MKKTVRIILLTLGLALFIQRTGWADIRSTFETLGWLANPSTTLFPPCTWAVSGQDLLAETP